MDRLPTRNSYHQLCTSDSFPRPILSRKAKLDSSMWDFAVASSIQLSRTTFSNIIAAASRRYTNPNAGGGRNIRTQAQTARCLLCRLRVDLHHLSCFVQPSPINANELHGNANWTAAREDAAVAQCRVMALGFALHVYTCCPRSPTATGNIHVGMALERDGIFTIRPRTDLLLTLSELEPGSVATCSVQHAACRVSVACLTLGTFALCATPFAWSTPS